MAGLKSLAKDTAIYGLSSIVGRFLNYLLVPLYTLKLPVDSGGYGVVTNIYAFTALLLVILTYGMETGFFRFVNKNDENSSTVYSTTLISVGSTSLLFMVICLLFLHPISSALGYSRNPEFIGMMAIVVGLDAFQAIPFAYLRYKKRPIKFAFLKLLFIGTNIFFNLFFLIICPFLYTRFPALIEWFYNPGYSVGYIFLSNLICTTLIMFCMIPELKGFPYKLDIPLLKRMLSYSFPILILGIAGILNQTVDKMIYPFLLEDEHQARVQLGIYGAASKVALILAMFTQAFRYAYEPFVFGKSNETDNRKTYADAMKYFIIFSLLAFLMVICYLDILRYLISPDYWEGLKVVPIVMGAEIFIGIYFNLSFWYKLIDETKWGAYFSLAGCVIIIVLNILFVPVYGYVASACAGLIGYFIITLLSYVVGQKKYPIRYDFKTIGIYFLLTILLYTAILLVPIENIWLRLIYRSLILLVYLVYMIKRDFPLSEIPYINRFLKKSKK